MKKTLLWLLIGPLALLLTLALAVNVIAWGDADDGPPDPATVIVLPDGARRPLGELVEAWSGRTRPLRQPAAPEQAQHPARPAADDPRPDVADVIERFRRERERFLRDGPPDGDLFGLAEWHRAQGSHEQAAALYASIPREHGMYARAQRRLAWDCYTLGQGEPVRGVAHAHASLAADPLSGNGWQDAARVYQPVAQVIRTGWRLRDASSSLLNLDESTDSPPVQRLDLTALARHRHWSTCATGCYAATLGVDVD